jgi:hypothetical protein
MAELPQENSAGMSDAYFDSVMRVHPSQQICTPELMWVLKEHEKASCQPAANEFQFNFNFEAAISASDGGVDSHHRRASVFEHAQINWMTFHTDIYINSWCVFRQFSSISLQFARKKIVMCLLLKK